jgi:hypothetical protein
VTPQLDCGRYAIKRTAGDALEVSATIFRDGHEQLRAAVRYRGPGARGWQEAPMRHVDSDRWTGAFTPREPGRWHAPERAHVPPRSADDRRRRRRQRLSLLVCRALKRATRPRAARDGLLRSTRRSYRSVARRSVES